MLESSRIRFRKALERKHPDKVPIDLGGHQTGIHVLAYKRIIELLGIEDSDVKIYDWNQQLAFLPESFLERFQIDTRTIYLQNTIFPVNHDMDKDELKGFHGYYDKFGIFWSCIYEKDNETRLFYEPMFGPFSEFTRIQEVKEYDWPKPDPKWFAGLKEKAKFLYNTTEYALIGRSVGSIFQFAQYLFGMQRFMKLMRTAPELIETTFECILNYASQFAEQYLGEIGTYIESIQLTDDLGDQRGPLINPNIFRNRCLPYIKRLVEKVKSTADVKVNFHSCGSCTRFISDLASIGIDSLNPVQVNAHDMEPCSLKKRFGSEISFWGAMCDSQSTLPFGSLYDIRNETIRNLNCLKGQGGYISAPIHNIVHDVKPENIREMLDTVIEFR